MGEVRNHKANAHGNVMVVKTFLLANEKRKKSPNALSWTGQSPWS